MNPDSSLDEGSLLFGHLFESNMDKPHQDRPASALMQIPSSVTFIQQVTVQDLAALITPAPSRPELLRRDPLPQNNGCDQSVQEASRSASEAARQASQSASQSIQQAQQSASEAARQASQSASQGIQQAQQQASQSIAQASRSASQAVSSASSALASAQSSAAQAMSRLQGSMDNIQLSASSAQAGASAALLQAGAAVAAATGSAAAAGSSFLAAATKATQGAAASASALGEAAASTINDANEQVSASRTAAVTATQAALAIVGSIIASAMITILIYFLIIRHQKKAKKKANESVSPGSEYSSDPKFPVSDQVGTTIAPSQSAYEGTRDMEGTRAARTDSDVSLSQFPATPSDPSRGNTAVKSTTIPWNPSKPPQAPKIGSWLKVEDAVSPFGSIRLPTDTQSKSPLGGQLKSPLQSNYRTNNQSNYRTASQYEPPPSSIYPSPNYPGRESKQSVFEIGKATVQQAMVRSVTIPKSKSQSKPPPAQAPSPPSVRSTSASNTPEMLYSANKIPAYRESKASVWIDDLVSDSGRSLYSQAQPGRKNVASPLNPSYMEIPVANHPVRTTAEWLSSIRDAADPPPAIGGRRESLASKRRESRSKSIGLPRSSKNIGFGMGGPRSTVGTRGMPKEVRDEQVKSVNGEIEYVQGLHQFFPQGNNGLERMGSDSTKRSWSSSSGRRGEVGIGSGTPGVGKAM